jgi:D-xylose transport system permease protein
MSSPTVGEDTTEKATLKSAMHDYWLRIKAGDIGSLPAVLGLVALCIVFGSMSSVFLTPGNFANLLTQAAAVIVIAMGLVFVLLLGEIDLSAGYTAGVTGAVLVILITNHDVPWFVALIASVIVGVILGFGLGTLVARLGIPSFVVTLAAFLAFQGILLLLTGEGGTIRVEDKTICYVCIERITLH